METQSPCRGMVIWDGYLVVVFNYSVEIFRLPSTQDYVLKLLASLDITPDYSLYEDDESLKMN